MRSTIVELDLEGYSDIARGLEELISAEVVLLFNDQIQGFVDAGLVGVGLSREQYVMATTGDGAILAFAEASAAHHFAVGVHLACQAHNRDKTQVRAQRWFRIGVATGDLAVKETDGLRRIAGQVIVRAVRLEAAGRGGEILADIATVASLPEQVRALYGPKEVVSGKRDETFEACRYSVVPRSDITSAKLHTEVPAVHSASRAGKIWKEKLDYLREQRAIAASPALRFELKWQIDEALEEVRKLGG